MRKILLALPVLFIALVFQNCTQLGDARFVASYTDPNAAFFNYPYTEKPEFYSHYQLIRGAKVSGNRNWRFFGAVSAGDAGVSVTYRLQLLAKDGTTICPQQDATLATGTGTVDFECDTPLDPLETKLIWRITINGQDHELIREQVFTAD